MQVEAEQAQQRAKLQHLPAENNRLGQIWQMDDSVTEIFLHRQQVQMDGYRRLSACTL